MAMSDLLGFVESSHSTTVTILLATTGFFIVASLVHVFLTWRRLRHIPGPFLNSITPLVLTWHSIKGDITVYMHSLSVKYGPLVRVAPNTVMFSDPGTFRHVCSAKSGYTKAVWFEFARWDLTRYSIIAMRDNESRKTRKAQLSPAASIPVIFSFNYPAPRKPGGHKG